MVVVSHDVVSNAFRFLAAVALLPGVFSVGRRIRIKGAHKPFLIGILALVLSFGLVSIDQQFGQYVPWLRWVRHLMVAVAGFGFAWAAWNVRQHELAVPAVRR